MAIISLLALGATSPFWTKILIPHFHHPDLLISIIHGGGNDLQRMRELDLDEIIWDHLTGEYPAALNISNRDSKTYEYDLEFLTPRPWDIKPPLEDTIDESGLRGGYPLEGGWYFRENNRRIAGNNTHALTFPFQRPTDDEFEADPIVITIYPEVKLSELGFPRFFGKVDLQPLQIEFEIQR